MAYDSRGTTQRILSELESQSRKDRRRMLAATEKPKTPPKRTKPELVPPPGGRICTVSVLVVESRLWTEAVESASDPGQMPDEDVLAVGEQCPPQWTAKSVRKDLLLINFGKHLRSDAPVREYEKKYQLSRGSPRSALAVMEQGKDLQNLLGMRQFGIASLRPVQFEDQRLLVAGWLLDGKRIVILREANYGWPPPSWFVFNPR